MNKANTQELSYTQGYKDAVHDVIEDLLQLEGFRFESSEGIHKSIIDVVDLLCIFKKYGVMMIDGITDKLSEPEIEKLNKVVVNNKIS